MKRRIARTRWWARGLMLLGALLLFAAPALRAAAATPKEDCCAEAPCYDQGGHDQGGHDPGKATPCPDACVLACHVLVTPEAPVVGPAEIGAAPLRPMRSLPPPGRALAPELPPPR